MPQWNASPVSRSLLGLILVGSLLTSPDWPERITRSGQSPLRCDRAVRGCAARARLGPAARRGCAVIREQDANDVTGEAQFVTSDAKIVTVDSTGTIVARGDGSATIAIRRGSLETKVAVTVRDFAAGLPVNFANQVVPIFTKLGCNSRRLPRQGERPERLPAQPAGLRAGPRLRDPGEGRARPAALPGRARAEPAAAQGGGPGAPRRRQEARARTRTNTG